MRGGGGRWRWERGVWGSEAGDGKGVSNEAYISIQSGEVRDGGGGGVGSGGCGGWRWDMVSESQMGDNVSGHSGITLAGNIYKDRLGISEKTKRFLYFRPEWHQYIRRTPRSSGTRQGLFSPNYTMFSVRDRSRGGQSKRQTVKASFRPNMLFLVYGSGHGAVSQGVKPPRSPFA